MNNPKQQAEELYITFNHLCKNESKAFTCIIVYCNGMLQQVKTYFDEEYPDYKYWQMVKVEAAILYNKNKIK